MKLSAGNIAAVTDGLYNTKAVLNEDRANFQHLGFANYGVNADMTAATTVAGSPYVSAIIIDLPAATDLTAFAYSMYNADGVGRTTRNFDVLVYNGTAWKVAASVGDIAGDANAWIEHSNVAAGANSYYTFEVALDETVATGATEVAVAYRRVLNAAGKLVYPGLGNYSSGTYLNITELAVYAK